MDNEGNIKASESKWVNSNYILYGVNLLKVGVLRIIIQKTKGDSIEGI